MSISQYPASSGAGGTSLAKKYLSNQLSNNKGTADINQGSRIISKMTRTNNNDYGIAAYAGGYSNPVPSDFAEKNFFATSGSTWRPLGDLSSEAYVSSFASSIVQYPTASFAKASTHQSNSYAISDLQTSYKFIAVGSSGRWYSSPDGLTWTDRGYLSAFNYSDAFSIVYRAGIFLAVGDGGKAVISSDGVTWTSVSTGITTRIGNIYYENSKFWLISGSKVASSSDGTNWTTVTVSGMDASQYNYVDFTYGNGIYFISNRYTNKLFKSTDDGATWSEVTSGPFYPASYNTRVDAIAYGDGKFVAVCKEGAKAYISTDGTNWTTHTAPFGWVQGEIWGLQFLDGKFIAIGTLSVVQSTNGVDWKFFGVYISTPYREIQKAGNEYFLTSYYEVHKTTELSKMAENFSINVFEPSINLG